MTFELLAELKKMEKEIGLEVAIIRRDLLCPCKARCHRIRRP